MKTKKILSVIIKVLLLITVVIICMFLWKQKQYDIISILIALFACLIGFLNFERKKIEVSEIVIIAVLISISVASRILFSVTPGFKPVTAIVIVSAIAFGSESGFLVGSLSALLSNIYFGQGSWTPFQMIAWGFVGYVAGLLKNTKMMNCMVGISIYGAIGGIVYSLILDIQTVLFIDNAFNLKRYIMAISSSLSFTIIYMVSNVIFLLVLGKPILSKLNRIKDKYGLYQI